MDIVIKASEHYTEGRYGDAFQLSAQFDRQQQEKFFEEIGWTNEEMKLKGRILIGAYKIEKEKDPEKKAKMLQIYDSLIDDLKALGSKNAA